MYDGYTMRYTCATLAYGYMRVYLASVCMCDAYVRFLVALASAGRVAIASDHAVYEHTHRAGHLILTSVITSLLSRGDRQGRDESNT